MVKRKFRENRDDLIGQVVRSFIEMGEIFTAAYVADVAVGLLLKDKTFEEKVQYFDVEADQLYFLCLFAILRLYLNYNYTELRSILHYLQGLLADEPEKWVSGFKN